MDSFGPNLAAGRLLLPDGEVLEAETTEAVFLASRLGARTTAGRGGDGHRNHGVSRVSLDRRDSALRAYFHEQRLILVSTCVTLPDDGSGWDDWTLEREMRRKDVHDAWLRSYLGEPPWSFAWGSIWSDYDPRSGGSNWGMSFRAKDAG